MAITKLMHMKEGKANASSHLKNSLNYILNDEKTMNGILVGSNCGIEANEIFSQMMNTKKEFGKVDKRQGYHFVISFDKFEASEEQSMKVAKNFCKQFFGDTFEYVYATHNDQDHMHAHIIFNSVSRSTGKKFHYKDGDWEKTIQPMVDRICVANNLEPLIYDKENKKGIDYSEDLAIKENKMTWKKIISKDIDFLIDKSKSYEDFLGNLKNFGYEVREGQSKKQGSYLSLKADGADRARRNYSLGSGYSVEDIKFRIAHKKEMVSKVVLAPRIKRTNLNKRPPNISAYQASKLQFIRQTYQYRKRSFQSQYKTDFKTVRRNLMEIDKISASCNYLLKNNIRDVNDLTARESIVEKSEQLLKSQRKIAYNTNASKENIDAINLQLRELRQEKKYINTNKVVSTKNIGMERRIGEKRRSISVKV